MNARSIRFKLTAWYATLLAIILIAFGSAVYFGLERYLTTRLAEQLSLQAFQIADTWLRQINRSGTEYIVNEIEEHISPDATGRFVRLTRSDGTFLYRSKPPRDGRFDPSTVAAVKPIPYAPRTREEHLAKGELLIYSLPYTVPGVGSFLVEVGAPYHTVENTLHGLVLIFAIILPIALALAIGVGFLLMTRALAPVDVITRTAETITSRNLSGRLPISHTGDEIERLSATLNRMMERLEGSFRQVVQFTADVSHELRTPLAVLRCELEVALGQNHLSPAAREVLESVLEETGMLSKIVEQLMTLSRLDSGELQLERSRLDLAGLCKDTIEQMNLLAEDKSIHLQCDAPEPVEIYADPLRIRQILTNLIDNAIKYTAAGGSVHIRIAQEDDQAILEVADTGPGIPTEALPYIFNRFYRVDKARAREFGGSGLGLAIAKSICDLHGGRIAVESRLGQGTRFRVAIPVGAN
ncbi:MAG: HAMP domain-containing protein [Acidobacteria bacterium]|nr:HAMP domain-containing protein [Acidobacteriota bacterium]MBI3657041.1 HAMP domain-containing protein [Acidobacteriota bacterium]